MVDFLYLCQFTEGIWRVKKHHHEPRPAGGISHSPSETLCERKASTRSVRWLWLVARGRSDAGTIFYNRMPFYVGSTTMNQAQFAAYYYCLYLSNCWNCKFKQFRDCFTLQHDPKWTNMGNYAAVRGEKKHPQTSISKKTMANKPNRWARWCSTLQRRGTSLNLPFTSDTVSPAIGNKSAFLSLPWSHGTIIPGDPRNHNNPDDVYWGRPAWYLHRG